MIPATSRVGLLSAEPLPQLFGQLARDRQTCVVRLALASGPAEVYLSGGQVVSVELPGNIDRLGDLLASGGAIDADTLRRTLAAPRLPGQRYGRLLVESGLVPEAKLQAALRLQIRRRLHRLFFTDEGEFVVELGDHDRGEGAEKFAVDLRPAIVLGVRSGWTEARYGSRIPNTPLRLAIDPAELAIYQLQPAELALLAPIQRAPSTVTQLVVAATEGGSALVRPTVYALFAAGAIVRDGEDPVAARAAERSAPLPPPLSFGGAASGVPSPVSSSGQSSPWIERPPSAIGANTGVASPSMISGQNAPARTTAPQRPPFPTSPPIAPVAGGRAPTPSPLSGPPPSRPNLTGPSTQPGGVDAAARAIQEKRAAIDAQDLFEVLGVSRESGKGEIKAAYLEAARLYHPDRLSTAGLLHLREAAEHIFRRVSEAHATLSDDARRAAYVERLDTPPEVRDAQAKAQRLVAAEMSLMEGEVALKRRDFPSAIERLAEAVQLNPDEGEAIALLAWARFSAGRAGLVEQRADFERAVAKSPKCARAHYYLGMVRKQARESQAAINSFRRAAELDPRLAEAASELRVLSLRATRELPIMQRPKGLLDRLLKK